MRAAFLAVLGGQAGGRPRADDDPRAAAPRDVPRPLRGLSGERSRCCRASAPRRRTSETLARLAERPRSTSSSARTACCRRTSQFRDLGLLVVDEEHRFGVKDKERIRALRGGVDVLTLTATPIPRTLNMSLSGIRDLCVIETPPVDRLAIRTYVTRYDEGVIRDAVLRELGARRAGVLRAQPRREHRRAWRAGWASSCPRRASASRTGRCAEGALEQTHARLHARRDERAGDVGDHRVGARHPARQHGDREPRRHVRPGAALPDPRPRRPLAPPRLRLPADPRRAPDHDRRPEAAARPAGARRPGRRLPARRARPRDPRRGQPARQAAVGAHRRGRARALHAPARAGGARAARPAGRARHRARDPARHPGLRPRDRTSPT